MPLEQELAAYRRELPGLLAAGRAGQFALVAGDALAGTWGTYDEALGAGYERFGTEQAFLVRRVEERERVIVFNN